MGCICFSQSRGPEVQDQSALGVGFWWGLTCWRSSGGVLTASLVCIRQRGAVVGSVPPLLIKTPAWSDYSGVRFSSFKWLYMPDFERIYLNSLYLSFLIFGKGNYFTFLNCMDDCWDMMLCYDDWIRNCINYLEKYPTK